MSEIRQIVGKNIEKLRKRREWSRQQLAEEMNKSRTYIYHLESGKANLELETLWQVAKALRVKLVRLFDGVSEPWPTTPAIPSVSPRRTLVIKPKPKP